MVEIDSIRTLKSRVQLFSSSTPCLFGVSVGRTGTDVDALHAGWTWTCDHFPTRAMLIGDSLVGLTLQAIDGLSPAAAKAEAGRLTAKLTFELGSWKNDAPQIIRTSDVVGQPRFDRWHQAIIDSFRTSPQFRESVQDDAYRYCARQERKRAFSVSSAKAKGIAIEYLLDEVAIYASLAEDGWLVETYLGSELGTLARLIRGALPCVAPVLERRTHISLRPASIRRAA